MSGNHRWRNIGIVVVVLIAAAVLALVVSSAVSGGTSNKNGTKSTPTATTAKAPGKSQTSATTSATSTTPQPSSTPAQAGTSGTGPGTGTTSTKPTDLTAHGLQIHFKLNSKVTDGKYAAFTSTIVNYTDHPIHSTSMQVQWNFGDGGDWWIGGLSDLTYGTGSNPAGGVGFISTDKHSTGYLWVNTGTLLPGKTYHLNGWIRVWDRSQANTPANAQFFNARLAVQASYAGKPNAGWTDWSNADARQYTAP